MYTYSNYIRNKNVSKVHDRVFHDVLRSKTYKSSAKPMDFAKTFESSKKALSKYDSLSRIKSGYLNSWKGSVITTDSKGKSTITSNNTNKTVDSVNSSSSTRTTSEVKNTNTLNVCNGRTFDVSLTGNNKATFTCENGQVYMSKESGKLNSNDMNEVGKIEQLITSLVHDASGNYVKSNFTGREIKDVLSRVGIKSGSFTINSTNGANKFYMLDSGKLYSDFEVESERRFYNNTDFIKCFGYSKNAVCKINGSSYKIDADGTFNIPSGVICLPETMEIKK